jgi:hypothetical protein
VKSSLKVWSCFLLWASNKSGYPEGLTDETLTLVLNHLGSVSDEDQARVDALIEALLEVAPAG